MHTLIQDLKFGARTLMKSPGFTAVAVCSLALGIGVITSIFSMVYSVTLNPIPFDEADRLVQFKTLRTSMGTSHYSVSYPDYRDFQEQSKPRNTIVHQY